MSIEAPRGDEDPSDPYARSAQTFPRLTASMLRRAAPYGLVVECEAGRALFERGQKHADFFIVIGGEVEIVYQAENGTPCVVTVHGAGEFTGEMDLLGSGSNLVTARARTSTTVMRIPRTTFPQFISAEPDIGEMVMRALILRRMGFVMHGQAGVVIVGAGQSADTLRVRRFLTRNNYPHRVVDVGVAPDALQLLRTLDLSPRELPAVLAAGMPPLRNPALATLSDALGLTEDVDRSAVQDVLVVGAGPAGLAAAVYAASEGLRTAVLESLAPGGQAGTSSKIENFLGFPTGISGHALASRAHAQAQKFGARLLISRSAAGLSRRDHGFGVRLDDGSEIVSRVVVVATGARYRRLAVEDCERFEGSGIHYAATPMEAHLCSGQGVMVVGGGNSAGQAALYLSRHARHVHVVVRGAALADTMSDYLVQRIARSPCITVQSRTEILAMEGDAGLRSVVCRHRDSGAIGVHEVANVFAMIGAEPNAAWLGDMVETDFKGFVCTGSGCTVRVGASPYETSQPGVFAVGDVRSGSVKRVASGVGEGSVVVQDIHRYFELQRT